MQIRQVNSITRQSTGLKTSDVELLLLKRNKLRADESQVKLFVEKTLSSKATNKQALAEAALSTFVFAQEEAGTAVAVSPGGLLLTCSHCIAGYAAEAIGKRVWLVSASGRAVQSRCIAWDSIRDLALMQIIAAESDEANDESASVWPHIKLCMTSPKTNARIFCVGHPGSEDLETDVPGTATGFDVLHVSEGRYRGCEAGQDVQDNSEIGALKHDAWTYWGHSGAPLVDRVSAMLVGLHSSWDDQTGMRRGIAPEAIAAFLAEQTASKSRLASDRNEEGSSLDNAIMII